MTDLTKTITPKSDQINSDDLIGRTMTIKVAKVSLCGEPDQPIAINFEGDGGKPYKPCKSMRRVLVNVWGGDGNAYVGRSMTIYRDDKVMFGGLAVGGIRISHLSDISEPVTMALTATRANRKPFTVKPLVAAPALAASRRPTVREFLDALEVELAAAPDGDAVDAIIAREDVDKAIKSAANGAKDRLNTMIKAALDRTGEEMPPVEEAA